MNPNDQTMAPVWRALQLFLVTVGIELLDHGFATTSPVYHWVEIAAGSVTTIGPAIWGIYTAVTDARRARAAQAKAVQAGLNLAASGNMLGLDGKPMTKFGVGTPPLPVTLASAPEIVKNYAPAVAAK